jgi:hypothetical protein
MRGGCDGLYHPHGYAPIMDGIKAFSKLASLRGAL